MVLSRSKCKKSYILSLVYIGGSLVHVALKHDMYVHTLSSLFTLKDRPTELNIGHSLK